MTEKQRSVMLENIKKHGENLRFIFSFSPSADMISICKKLLALELKTNKIMTDFCNGFIESDILDYAKDKTLNTLCFILRLNQCSPLARSLIINSDARGYALKISADYVSENNLCIYRDMGGYGIIAPDFRIINKP